MDTIISGTSAFRYWRIPPVVQLLVAGPEDDPLLNRLLKPDDLLAMQAELATSLPLSVACAGGKAWRRVGADAQRIREINHLLAPACDLPVEVMVHEAKECHRAGIARPRLWSADLPFGALRQIAPDVCVTSPAFTMLQLASRLSLPHTVMLASELCGSFTVFHSPAPVARVLQGLIDRGCLPEIAGWRPSLKDGKLSDLWMRPPLVVTGDLLQIAAVSESRSGRAALERAANLVAPGAASPFEVQTAMILGFPRSLGGEGLSGFTHNERIPFSPDARLLAGKDCCYCDLYWEEGVDVECQSIQFHDSLGGYISDSERAAALKVMGIEVVPVTYDQLLSQNRIDALVRLIAKISGHKVKKKTGRQLAKGVALRSEVLCNWIELPD